MLLLLKRWSQSISIGLLLTGISPVWAQYPDDAWREGPVTSTVGSLQFRECELESEGRSRRVECAVLEVPEDYQALENGRTLEIFIARLTSTSIQPEPDPVLMLAGGPGQAASQAFLFYDRVFSTLARDRDFYLIDQRGTGRSNPQHCDVDAEEALLLEPSPDEVRASARACLEQFDGDPRQYTTSVAIQDFERVRLALGIAQWNLYGVSYGTRVAQHYMRRYPELIRTAVLDSVVYPELNLGPDIPILSQRALDRLLQRCQQDPACHRSFPDLEQGLTELLRALEDAPETVVYEDVRTGHKREMSFSRGHLLGLIRMHLYSSEQVSILPPMLHAAYADNNYAALARAATDIVEQMDRMLTMGMHNSVICTEDVPFYDAENLDRAAMEKTYMGDLVPQALEQTCDVWPEGVRDANFKAPLESQVPTVLFSGEHDPITPPAYAERVLEGLSFARHFVVPGQGHSVSVLGCAPVMIAKFIEETDVANLDGSCLERLSAAPLFIDFNGPSP